ncbi:hypothetical protein [Streptomyces sp. NPDC001851]|uniref:hypothetical protein n=1 Tax=Streptomyces sp. NPDC001851 TaxID=3154529 RepID=UPI003329E86C
MRSGLPYGSGAELEDAVAVVLRAAGFAVTYLDEELGGTMSADLLTELNGSTCPVEVKSASDAAERNRPLNFAAMWRRGRSCGPVSRSPALP